MASPDYGVGARASQLDEQLAAAAKTAAAAGEGHQHAAPAFAAPKPRKAVLGQAAFEETAQHALHDGPQRAVLAGEALGPDPQQLLEVPLDETVER